VARYSSRVEARRAEHKRYKEDVSERGKPFFPFAMFHDTVMSFVVVSVIIGLAVVWKYSIPGDDGTEPGWLGPLYTDKADPGTTNFIPRPDWYFYFLFYLLRIFKWPDSVILATVGIPTIALILLLMLPFLDVRPERRISRRPVAVVAGILTVISMGVLTYKGATARESLGSENLAAVDSWMARNNLAANARKLGSDEQTVRQGAEYFAAAGCQQCHIYLGAGSQNLGAPELSAIGAQKKGIDYQIAHLKCPSCVTPGSPMPRFEDLGEDTLRKIAVFLESSQGEASGPGS
jgi:menaquinol-cytochrome c reductase cytochrome b/c subunit